MSDLSERLRRAHEMEEGRGSGLYVEAADEIAGLRAQLAEANAAVSALNGDVHKIGQQLASARKALEPFAHTGWLPYDAERDGLTVIAYVHADSRRELDLSSNDFFRAAAVLKETAQTDEKGIS